MTVPIQHIREEKRFNPKYFYFYEKKNDLLDSSTIQFAELGDKKYIDKLTDGIHSAVNLSTKGKIKYLYVKNIKEGFIDITDNIYLDEKDHNLNISKELKKKDVLLTVVGSLGETAMVSNYLKGKINLPRNIAFIRTKEDKLLPEFLTSFFLSKFAKEQSIYSGGGNIQGLLSLTKLKKFIYPVPEMEIQEKFKKQYSYVLELQNNILENIEECKKIFYKDINIDFGKFRTKLSFSASLKNLKDSSIWTPNLYDKKPEMILNEIEKKFDLKPLKTLVTIKKGNEIGSVNYKDYLSRTDSCIPFIRTSDIYNYEINSYPSYYANIEIYNELNQDFKTGDIIVNNDGRIGYPAIITNKDKAIYQSHIRRLRVKKEYSQLRNYIFLCLIVEEIGGMQFKKNTVVQSTIPTLANRLKDIVIPIISDSSIKMINEKIDEILIMIEKKKTIIEAIKKDMNDFLGYV